MAGKKKKRTIFSYIGIFLAIVPAETESIETEPAETAAPEEESPELKEGELRYQGYTYAYKQGVMTFLFMGIDKKGEMKASENRIKGGQADAIFLLVLDPEDLSIGVIAVNRDTMTDVEVYDSEGAFVETRKAQIALQHAYGDGLEESCERTVAAVSRLFYGITIHGYCAVNMEAITLLNDFLGGVDVTPGEDIYIGQKLKWKAGEPVHLEGRDAFTFVQNRDITVEQSAEGRLVRQKLYLQAFMDTAKSKSKKICRCRFIQSCPTIWLRMCRRMRPLRMIDFLLYSSATHFHVFCSVSVL